MDVARVDHSEWVVCKWIICQINTGRIDGLSHGGIDLSIIVMVFNRGIDPYPNNSIFLDLSHEIKLWGLRCVAQSDWIGVVFPHDRLESGIEITIYYLPYSYLDFGKLTKPWKMMATVLFGGIMLENSIVLRHYFAKTWKGKIFLRFPLWGYPFHWPFSQPSTNLVR